MRKSDVLAHFGGVQATADALRITRAAVYQWGAAVPKGTAFELQVMTGGKLQVNPSMYEKKTLEAHA